MDNLQQHHEMRLEKTHPTGAEEWYCPTCGRRFLMQWPPVYKKIVIEPGDQYVQHSGGKGGMKMGNLQVTNVQDPSENFDRDQWEAWLKDVDFDKRLDDDSIDLK
jgi:hypothetical protein